MNAKIYIIKNDVNDKVYIGQTAQTLDERFKQHCYDSTVKGKLKRPLYLAMQKYGIEKFHIFLIEECDSNKADEREQHWIAMYNSYRDGGYNATIGGKAYKPYNYDDIKELLRQGKTTKEIMAMTGCCKQMVHKVAKLNQMKIPGGEHNHGVTQCDENGPIRFFENIGRAAKYIKETVKPAANEATIRKNISRCCNHIERTKAYGYVWR